MCICALEMETIEPFMLGQQFSPDELTVFSYTYSHMATEFFPHTEPKLDQDPNLSPLQTPQEAGHVKVVLCQPSGSLNVGSVCRAMRSMGFSQLYIIGRNKEFFNRHQVETMGLNSTVLFDEAQFSPNLEPVLADCSLVVGLTRRRGSRRKYFSLVPEQLKERVAQTQGKIALLFGNERIGLEDKELQACNLACHIPTHPQQPSLNLSHSVQIILYELSRLQSSRDGINSGLQALDQGELQQFSKQINQDMEAMGLTDHLNNQRTEVFLQDILARAMLSQTEGKRLLRMFKTMRYHQNRP